MIPDRLYVVFSANDDTPTYVNVEKGKNPNCGNDRCCTQEYEYVRVLPLHNGVRPADDMSDSSLKDRFVRNIEKNWPRRDSVEDISPSGGGELHDTIYPRGRTEDSDC